jgi:glycerol-3-phosphate acyltransferase PlsY
LLFITLAAPSYVLPVLVLGYIIVAVVSYLLGSIPSGFLVAKARGIDIRSVGSGNIGATNVLRILGKPAGIFVMFADTLKGALAVLIAVRVIGPWFSGASGNQANEWYGVCAGVAAILGHNFTCWLSFKGGKGIATSAGVLVALVPWSLLIILAVWIVTLALTRFVSLASVFASATLPFAAWMTGESPTMILITGGLAVLAIYKHRTNIKRLLNGTESRIGSPKPTGLDTSYQRK